MRLSKISSIVLVLAILLIGLTMAQGRYQVVNNPNFIDGLNH